MIPILFVHVFAHQIEHLLYMIGNFKPDANNTAKIRVPYFKLITFS